jgi:hypothetical protein
VSVRTILHAQALLLSNDGLAEGRKTALETAEILGISHATVNSVRKLHATSGLDAALKRKTRVSPPVASKITGDFEARVLADACDPAPLGCAGWTLRLLAEHVAETNILSKYLALQLGKCLARTK